LLSRWPVLQHRHEDMSDHRLEQRGLLHVSLHMQEREVHVIVVHLGLLPGSRIRQTRQLHDFIARVVPADAPLLVAGDFNDWGNAVTHMMATVGLHTNEGKSHRTYPSRVPLVQLDHVYARGMHRVATHVPRGPIWGRMSDHLPLLVEFAWDAP
jgi:endonuclease/exonuclease/phosphatase family metal-dependent hydrolase